MCNPGSGAAAAEAAEEAFTFRSFGGGPEYGAYKSPKGESRAAGSSLFTAAAEACRANSSLLGTYCLVVICNSCCNLEFVIGPPEHW